MVAFDFMMLIFVFLTLILIFFDGVKTITGIDLFEFFKIKYNSLISLFNKNKEKKIEKEKQKDEMDKYGI